MPMGLWRLALAFVMVVSELCCANMIFDVRHKFADKGRNLKAIKAHDTRRLGRLLSHHSRLLSTVDVDLSLGGNDNPSEIGLYFTKIGLGSPSKDYYVQVDTGSDILWVNCAGCDKCPTKSDLGIPLSLYSTTTSSTSSLVYCDQDFCTSSNEGQIPGCKPNLQCKYNVVYGDGSSTAGYFVKDAIQLHQVTGNLQTGLFNATVVFGCGAKQSGQLGSSNEALDGIVGFGQASSSMISQLAASGKVKRKFAHCLDNIDGGGIFAIGDAVSPNVTTTPMVPHAHYYIILLKGVEVGDALLDLPSDAFDNGDSKGSIVDSGTTLAYFPSVIYDTLMAKVVAQQPQLNLHAVEEQFTCFHFSDNVDDGFPVVKFHFEDSLVLTVYPHDYLFAISEDVFCFGWQDSGSKEGQNMILLGDLVLSNKLVVYDIENQTIGWTEYNCSSSIKMKDEWSVGAHDLSSASSLRMGEILSLLSILIALLHSFIASIL